MNLFQRKTLMDSANERRESRWGGLDFDAHSGESGRARELAFAAFRVLLNSPGLAVVLETSGSGGWHVWAISPDFHETTEWIHLLKNVTRLIGVPVAPGVCEIFPPDSLRPVAGIPQWIRALKLFGKIPALPLNQSYRGSQKAPGCVATICRSTSSI